MLLATRVRLQRRPQSLSGTCPAARPASPWLGCQCRSAPASASRF
uniref:Uncharacterized protein n=1 Tax=Arundo donax TaxID=35708 RepID=A0A0A9A0J9_ARUDO